jgi:hypothetical protein
MVPQIHHNALRFKSLADECGDFLFIFYNEDSWRMSRCAVCGCFRGGSMNLKPALA